MIKDGVWVGIAQFITIPLGIVTAAIVARSLSLDDYGIYQLALSYLGIIKISTLPGMTSSITKGVLRGYDTICLPIIKRCFTCSLIGLFILFIFGSLTYIIKPWDSRLGILLIISSFIMPVYVFERGEAILKAKRDFKLSRQIAIWASIFSFVTIGYIAYTTKDLYFIFLTTCISQATIIIGGFIVARKKLVILEKNLLIEKELLKFGWKMTLLDMFNFIVGRIDRVIIGAINPALLAIYHVGARFPEMVKSSAKVFLNVPIMHWSILDKNEHVSKLEKHWWIFVGAGIIATLIVWITSPWIIPALFGEKYIESVYVARWLSIGLGAIFLEYNISNLDVFQTHGSYYRRAIVFSRVVYIIILTILVRKYQVTGLVISVLTYQAISFVSFLLRFKSLRQINRSYVKQ